MTTQESSKGKVFLKLLEEAEGARLRREFTGPWRWIFKSTAALYSVVLIVSVITNFWTSSDLRGMFIMFVVIMIMMRYPATRRSPRHRPSAVDFLLMLCAVAAFGNFVIDYEQMAWRAGDATTRDIVFGSIAIVLVLEGCRRAMSMVLPILALMMMLYAWAGPYVPGELFGHQGFSSGQIIGDVYASMNGIFGFVAYVFIAFVMLFVIMGSIFERFGAGAFFIDLPIALMARYRGGPAKAAVIASCMFGMISGSATANAVATGSFTIPLMKRTGYRPEVAAGIEAATSMGGMFMPPVMGAGAFLMAEMLRIPYAEVARVALVPALLYFFGIMVMVHFEALRTGIGIVPVEERLSARTVFRKGWYFLAPLAVLFYVLFTGSTASLAAFYAIGTFLMMMAVRFFARRDFKQFFVTLFDALADGGDKSLIVGSTAGPVGIIVGIALLSGLAFKFSALVMSYTFGMKWMALLLVMFATFVLGMGTTVTADYLILALLAVPAMGQMGIPLLAAHLSAFWFSQTSNVTPPVCMAAVAAAGIAGAHPYRTAMHAMKFSAYHFVMPFMFVYSPLLMLDGFNFDVLTTWIVLFVSTVPFAAGAIGYFFGPLGWVKRSLMLLSSFVFIFPAAMTYLAGAALFALVAVPQYLAARRSRPPAAAGAG